MSKRSEKILHFIYVVCMFFLQDLDIQLLVEYNDQYAGWGTGRMLANQEEPLEKVCMGGEIRGLFISV